MKRRILIIVLLCVSLTGAIAQQRSGAAARLINSSSDDKGRIYYGNIDEPARAIEFNEKAVTTSAFLANINTYFNIPALFRFSEVESNTDKLRMRHHLLQQYYNGIPIEGLSYRVHEKDGFVKSANGRAIKRIQLNAETNLTEGEAFELAKHYTGTRDTTARDARKLIVSKNFTYAPESFFIAFQFDIDVSIVERWRISIDARTGELINKVSLVNTCSNDPVKPLPFGVGSGMTNYYGNKSILVEKFAGGSSRLVGQTSHGGTIGTYDFRNAPLIALLLGFGRAYDITSSTDNYSGTYNKPAASVQWAMEQVFEYYYTNHERNSFDNLGSAVKSYVHLDVNLNNAFWTGQVLAFGDGSNNNPLVELDVVGHEFTHGVTQYEARLQYNNEPGALNESFSDILGKAIEFDTFGDSATWQLSKYYRPGGMRDFSNPNLKDQPDTYMGDLWYTGFEDNGGVHYNSGVQNYWFYLLCEGGSGVNDHEMEYVVQSIGMEAATNIAYRNLTEYLSEQSDYLDSRIGSLLAAADLHGKNSTVYQEVANAWDAVGVIDEPIITGLELFDITATTVKIKGSFSPRGDTASYHFEYGTTPAFGSVSATQEFDGTVEGMLTGLQSETHYYLRLVASNENGDSYANIEFTTISLAPLVKIKHTVDVTKSAATLYGEINPNSLPTTFHFEYGLTPALGLSTPTYTLPDTTEFMNVSASVAGLEERKTYYYKLIATNGFSSIPSEAASFFTATRPVINSFTPVTAHPGTEITITGSDFNPVAAKNVVRFGATRATVVSSTPGEIKVKVPGNASLGTISLQDEESGLRASSVHEFVPTFTGEFHKSSLQLRVGITDVSMAQPMIQDMDGDNRPDIVGTYNQGFLVYQNVSSGGDLTQESFIRNAFPSGLSGRLQLADFDGNGRMDIVGRFSTGLRIYPNFSVPGFIFFETPLDVPTGYVNDFLVEDFDQDGHPDIATVRYVGDSCVFSIIRNQNPKDIIRAGNFVLRHEQTLPFPVHELYHDDLDNDGKPDVVCGAFDRMDVPVLRNESEPGTFTFTENLIADSTRSRFAYYFSQDLNQDGWKDIGSFSQSGDIKLSVLQNKGTSPIISMGKANLVTTGYTDSRVVQMGDINGDGRVDLMTGIKERKFILLTNNTASGEDLSPSSFGLFGTFNSVGTTSSQHSAILSHDLNGDGRPEVIITHWLNQFPFNGYQTEIWQNTPAACPDPAQVSFAMSNTLVKIVLPSGKTMDQYEISYRLVNNNTWNPISSSQFAIWEGYSYQIRVRAKCFLGVTDYHYTDIMTDCVDTNTFEVLSVSATTASLNATNYGSFEVQYSLAGKNTWISLPQSVRQITNLLPGTTYDIRFRGRCNSLPPFKMKQFTTRCPQLSALAVSNLAYNRAVVLGVGIPGATVKVEYSIDNINWMLTDATGNLSDLTPGRTYFLRGRLECSSLNSDFIYTTFTTPCPTVSELSVNSITPFAATIMWEDESVTGQYLITYSSDETDDVVSFETNVNTLQLNDLSPGTRYTLAVAPQCLNSEDFTTITFTTVCFEPFDLIANTITQTSAELSWDDDYRAVPFFIDYSIAGSNVWHTVETTELHATLNDLRPGTLYDVRLHINCLSVPSPFVHLNFETGLYGEATVAPNPTFDRVTIHPSKDMIGTTFTLLDNTGRVMAHGKLRDYTLDLSALSPGVYTLKIGSEKPLRISKN